MAKFKKPMFIEKPLSNDINGLSKFPELVEKYKVKVLIGYVLRYDFGAQYFHQLLKSEEMGELLYVRIEWIILSRLEARTRL